LLFSIWENIEDGFIIRIRQNSLVLFSAGIAFESINGKYFRQFRTVILNGLKISE